MEWYYGEGGQRRGPVSQEEFDLLVQAGAIRRSTLVWRTGMQEWTTWGELRATPPPPEVLANFYIDGRVRGQDIRRDQQPTVGPRWERGGGLWFMRLFATAAGVFFRPLEFYRELGELNRESNPQREGSHTSFLVFTGILLGFGTGLFDAAVGLARQMNSTGSFSGGLPEEGLGRMLAFYMLFAPLLSLLGAFITTVILHCSLIALGTDTRFEPTQRVVYYTQGAMNILGAIPLLGTCLALIYAPVLLVIGLRAMHDITTSRAMVVVFVQVVLFCSGMGYTFQSMELREFLWGSF